MKGEAELFRFGLQSLGRMVSPMARETFQIDDLTAVIGDNEGYDGHRAGYNGVHRLTHRSNPKSLFTVAGPNLEHIFENWRTTLRK